MRAVLWAAGLLSLGLPGALGVKTHDFKTCSQSGFCRRGRALSARAAATENWTSPYAVDGKSVRVEQGGAVLRAGVKSSLYADVNFALEVRLHEDGVVRVRMDETGGLRQRYDGAAAWALTREPLLSTSTAWATSADSARAARDEIEVVVEYAPLRVALARGGVEHVVLNGRGLFHMEHFRKKPEAAIEDKLTEGTEQTVLGDAGAGATNPRAWFEGEEEDAFWEETFGSWTDAKPKGPESLSLDISFPVHGQVYGIPQHASPLALPTTTGEGAFYEDPYRLWNSDVFEYAADSTMSLYGSIPLLHAHGKQGTVGVFNALGSETFVDVHHPASDATNTYWISESGVLDVFLLPGPTPEAVFQQYAGLTGTPPLPAIWQLGYHQCRWNYVSSDDVRTVQRRFDEEDMPVDVFWLDIDYSPDHKYFIWKDKEFPDPVEMTNDVAANKRKMVVIIDPHLKRADDFAPYKEAADRGVLVKNKDGNDYEGWCWPGSSSWVDFFHPDSWAWWHGLFRTTPEKTFTWTKSTNDVHIWNDMNEPSVFNGPEISMPRDNIHHGGWEHRDVHNINGMLFTNATWQGVLKRSGGQERPFVLTRSFFAGSQRFGAMWTGDNLGTWEHMARGIPMVLSNGIAGMTFGGADVGGFFGNPDPEMLTRWYQLGIFNPFFRAHAHIDTKRREPFLLDEPYKSIVKASLRLRYTMLPVWYTAFREASARGVPILRPHYVAFPEDENGWAIDDQYLVGNSGLLVKPVTQAGATEVSVYLPDAQPYYDYFGYHVFRGAKGGVNVTVPAPLEKTPLLLRGGHIVPTRERPRRSAQLMAHDPFTLRVALSSTQTAQGELYLDAGDGYAYRTGAFVWRAFTAAPHERGVRISSRDLVGDAPNKAVDEVSVKSYDPVGNAYAKEAAGIEVERIVVLGLASKPTRVALEGGRELAWTFEAGVAANSAKQGTASVLTIKRPGMSVAQDWAIVIA